MLSYEESATTTHNLLNVVAANCLCKRPEKNLFCCSVYGAYPWEGTGQFSIVERNLFHDSCSSCESFTAWSSVSVNIIPPVRATLSFTINTIYNPEKLNRNDSKTYCIYRKGYAVRSYNIPNGSTRASYVVIRKANAVSYRIIISKHHFSRLVICVHSIWCHRLKSTSFCSKKCWRPHFYKNIKSQLAH